MQIDKFLFAILLAVALFSCNSGPKVVEADDSAGEENSAPIFSETPMVQGDNAAAASAHQHTHTVVVKEVMNTERYSYLRVTENDQEFWIAIAKREVKVGGTYYFNGGLLKKNFQSQEFNRMFETLYLVSDFRDQESDGVQSGAMAAPQSGGSVEPPTSVTPAPGAIKIAELVGNLSKYDGKVVKVTGKCVKINPMIMGRNWVHLQDGSGKNIDLTVTTTENIQLGSLVTLEGTIALNKDFGAGYRYDYIMEGAVVVK